ncbi:hypothetical protein TWF225_003989 [Orbilia oligospora]|uniref:Uncharacterized protein n=1 Tax=Orbilia oligospora TaxID=2813651 RepID=A0A8H2HKR2_ORBOL|nr:hypothetical protein TWF225_003989 [Orbilia oligospora]KAF3248409.1 hypothetical protein TWF128_008396 [Orbilia oligospora]KAF3256886.1 hypothetical protein TWF217_006203 [Orbilia oligospora]KAF3294064.1 hypothetical protein TWF132_003937 [Orbilia oligospora]TGJ62838.1 hypothetical protein EYR41_012019 [Orbilia oligospora]
MDPSPPQAESSAVPLSSDLETLTSVYSEAAAYLAKLTAQLAELETTQTTLLHSYHATSTALADIRGYNAVAPAMELLPVYTAKVAQLKQLMGQQRQAVDRMKVRAEEIRKVKAGNHERLKKRWEEERERDKGLTARMVGAVGMKTGVVNSTGGKEEEPVVAVGKVLTGNGKVPKPSSSSSSSMPASRIERQLEVQGYQGPGTSVDAPEPSIPPTIAVATKTVVKRKKKARQAEIE